MRKLPDVPLSPCPPEYARLVAHGWDSVQEAWAFAPTPAFVAFLEGAQAAARAVDETDGVVVIEIAGLPFKVSARGAKRYRWRFENDDFIVLVGVPKLSWAISIRYLSAGLWEHGWDTLRNQVLEILRPNTIQREKDCVRVTRADYCFDFYSPTLTEEFRRREKRHFVLHSSVKKILLQNVGISERDQTFTLGLRSTLQIQLYDKTLEIVEQSGKQSDHVGSVTVVTTVVASPPTTTLTS